MVSICESNALQVLGPNRIIYAIGTELRVCVGEEESSLQWQCPRKIHGIDSSQGLLLVWGERYFMLFSFQESQFSLQCSDKLSDWISSGKLLSNDEICLVTAHSVAVRIKHLPDGEVQIIEKSSCKDKSTLYSSYLLGEKWTDLTVFGGNAFGEVIIWHPNSKLKRAPILRRITAHKGVVFSINIHPAFGLLTTTSDDRSVRFWRIQIEKEKLVNWEDITIECYRSSYGHSARVFQAKIIEKENASYVISCGEDQTVCLWNSCGELVGKIKRQMGSVLDCAYDSAMMTLFASTSSGNIFKHGIQDMFAPISAREISFPLEADYVSKAKFLSSTHIVGVSSRNKLFLGNVSGGLKYEGSISAFKVTVLEVFDTFVFTGGYKVISVYIFSEAHQLEKVFELSLMDSIIRSIFPFSAEEVLVSSESGVCKFTTDQFRTSIVFETPPSKERWITAALKMGNFLVLSNRQGNLLLYTLNKRHCSLISLVKHIHGYLGVTQMLLEKRIGDKYFFRTCGHDSTVKIVRLDETSGKLDVVHTENIPVAWIERMEMNDSECNKTILGFNDNHFVIWKKPFDFLHQISCGGGHRCWDAKLDFKKNEFRYIYVKNKQLHFFHGQLRNVSLSKIKIIGNQWHVKACNVLRAFSVNDSLPTTIIISGGEDNLLKFSKCDLSNKKQCQFVNEVFLHISSIKAIEKVNTSRGTWLVISAGGRAQICVSQVNIDDFSIEEKCNFMLKSSDFDRKYQRDRQDVDFDPETRIMALAVLKRLPMQSDTFHIFAGCSDGYLRLFSYKEDTITLLTQAFYGKCILHTRVLDLQRNSFLISCATDGNLCFWQTKQFSSDSLPFFKLKHHNSGINSIDIKIEDDLLYVATGGDDQTVVVSKIKVVDGNLHALEIRTLDFLHTAQVNGVYITDSRRFLYTTGVDQKVCKVNLGNFELERSVFTCVADAKGLIICELSTNSNMCFIFGCGLQLFEL